MRQCWVMRNGALLERDFLIGNLLTPIHFIMEMIWWTGLAPWEFELPFSGSLISTVLTQSETVSGPPNLGGT